ncbi:hypothetical protein ZIOFF_034337 [Zingiber officinale]|uniref:Alcohol dehydrogenase-like N-terminal domain-containing protein n=1 Tax=Zingiber officinale TaxID=94328 RepID=A0A8J5L8B3_ZINOF|nr:hypothetical protein ZIOFF_034337 [Zingiber officinale]
MIRQGINYGEREEELQHLPGGGPLPPTYGWPARDTSGVLSPFNFSRSHEIVGVATEVGGKVGWFKVGDHAGVGCTVNFCRSCHESERHLENSCPRMVLTYNATEVDGTITYGGYSDSVVVEETFVVRFRRGGGALRGGVLSGGGGSASWRSASVAA